MRVLVLANLILGALAWAALFATVVSSDDGTGSALGLSLLSLAGLVLCAVFLLRLAPGAGWRSRSELVRWTALLVSPWGVLLGFLALLIFAFLGMLDTRSRERTDQTPTSSENGASD